MTIDRRYFDHYESVDDLLQVLIEDDEGDALFARWRDDLSPVARAKLDVLDPYMQQIEFTLAQYEKMAAESGEEMILVRSEAELINALMSAPKRNKYLH